jgi:hypothetical protein
VVAKKSLRDEDARPSYKSLWVIEGPDIVADVKIGDQENELAITPKKEFYLRMFGTKDYLLVLDASSAPSSSELKPTLSNLGKF